jgi:nucleotide-binding universal stress UspA family protein
MISYKNILYCTDYSEDADIALLYAADFALRYQARLHVLHILQTWHRYSPLETGEGSGSGGVKMAEPELIAHVEGLIKERYARRLTQVPDVLWRVLPGVPFVEIVRYARENEIDLIVMGSSGNSELGKTQYGSTVENVSRRAHCHVMAIRNPEKAYTLES